MNMLRPTARTVQRTFVGLLLALFVSVERCGAEDTPSAVALAPLTAPGGRSLDLAAPEKGVCVVVFYSSECPISNAYSPTLNRLVDRFPGTSMKLVGVCVDFDLSDDDVAAHAKEFGLKFPVARDLHAATSRKLRARVTPEAFVIDAKGQLRYHGRIDDQFAARGKRNEHAKTRDLENAIAAVLNGEAVKTAYLEPVGCPIPKPR